MKNKEFIVCFYQDGETTIFNDDNPNGEIIQFKKNMLLKVSEREMFKWLEISHHDKIKIAIYEAKLVCDLS